MAPSRGPQHLLARTWVQLRPRYYTHTLTKSSHHRPFHRTMFTKDQIKTAELQKTPHTPNQIVTEVPHSNEPSFIDVPSPLWFHRLGPLKDFFSGFSRLQRRRPLTMCVATSLVTYLCGDLIAQEIGGEEYDAGRTARMLVIGGLASIPGYKWFLYLGSHFNTASKFRSIAIKVLIQQFFFAPLFNTYFFGMQAALAGHPPSVILHRIAQAVPQSVVSSAKFWPVVTALNFAVIPAHLRFAFSGVFAVIWQTYLSFLNRREEKAGPRGSLVEEGREKLLEEAKEKLLAEAKAVTVVPKALTEEVKSLATGKE